jgi:PAS domain S-box-containing protein
VRHDGRRLDVPREICVPDSLLDLGGLRVTAEDFLAAVVATAAQPIWVVDPNDVIRFANPAAIAALGYDDAGELAGRRSHETIHYKHPDGSPYPAAECQMRRPRATGETVSSDLDWFCRRDGSMFPVSYVAVPVEMTEGRGAVVAFTDIEDRLRAERVLREHDAALSRREDALRRIAVLVAGGAASADVVVAIAREVGHVVGVRLVTLLRYEPDGASATVIGAWGEEPNAFQVGTCWPLDGPSVTAQVLKTGRPAKIEDFSNLTGSIAEAAVRSGIRARAGAPIIVNGKIWGVMLADTAGAESLPDDIEDRLAEFTELVATAISNTTSREQITLLAEEQAALRRVATLVAREPPPAEIFAAVAEEVARLLGVEDTTIFRYEDDWTATVVADRAGDRHVPLEIGSRMSLDGESATVRVRRTGRPARVDDFSNATGPLADYTRDAGIGSSVASPIVVDGRLWGAVVAATRDEEPMPPDTEARIGQFTELVATAIANVETRAELAASRARIVAAADEERRRVVRDLHDGAQQRLVHTVVTLKLAQAAYEQQEADAADLLAEALEQAEQATEEVRELAHGILPSVLTRGGLRAGVDALAARMAVPIENGVSVGRLPPAVEATAYFVVAECLTNVTKHACAGCAAVEARLDNGTLRLEVRDDGVGGAQADGSGLVGLADRLAVLNGRLWVESPAEGGTVVVAELPVSE